MEIVNLLPPHPSYPSYMEKTEGKIVINLLKIQPCEKHYSYEFLYLFFYLRVLFEIHLHKVISIKTKVLFSCIRIQLNFSLKWSTGPI